MSIRLNEVAFSIAGAVRLARFDAGGLDYFGDSTEAFWKSFWAPVLIAPFFFLLLLLKHGETASGLHFLHNIFLELLAYAIAWLAFPVVLAALSRSLGVEARFVRYIVAYNWCGVIQNGVYLPIAIFGFIGVMSVPTANLLTIVAIGWVLVYTYFITRSALGVTGSTAVGIVVMDLALGIVIDLVSSRML
jgi:hypothetical protein